MNSLKKITIVISIFFVNYLFAQQPEKEPTISLEETLKFINSLLGDKIVFDLKDGDIIIKYYDNKNRLFRTDRVDTEHLDWKHISYAEEDMLFVLPCYEDDGKCVERKFHITKEGDLYARTSFRLKRPEDFEPMKKAVTHLIRTVEEFDYRNNEPFDK
jgi:hypothetical protein